MEAPSKYQGICHFFFSSNLGWNNVFFSFCLFNDSLGGVSLCFDASSGFGIRGSCLSSSFCSDSTGFLFLSRSKFPNSENSETFQLPSGSFFQNTPSRLLRENLCAIRLWIRLSAAHNPVRPPLASTAAVVLETVRNIKLNY
jgi:hypothetical protein